ncbi:hypothetical protein D3C72_1736260 [compost metagenome]
MVGGVSDGMLDPARAFPGGPLRGLVTALVLVAGRGDAPEESRGEGLVRSRDGLDAELAGISQPTEGAGATAAGQHAQECQGAHEPAESLAGVCSHL